MAKNGPIGLFDSGVGGLTVAHALHTLLPNEQLVYFGDTAHLPYGDKSRESIVQYSLGITDFLLEQNCKMIMIACNSASSNAFDEVKAHVGDRAVVMNVIDPVVNHVCVNTGSILDSEGTPRALAGNASTVGIIGTKATIDSGTYERKIRETLSHLLADSNEISKVTHPGLNVSSLATPLFVPMIEEGFVFDDISNAIIRSYLSRKELNGIDTLILGCTHYPIIRNQISRFLNFEVNVLDTPRIVALSVQELLSGKDLLATSRAGDNQFYVSDHTPYFGVIANMFFNEKISLLKRNIWG
ncbi:MAG: glutamate racemase [Bacteroidales bacterium]|nr:glutamate racemase [Bacteroidales bacterium]